MTIHLGRTVRRRTIAGILTTAACVVALSTTGVSAAQAADHVTYTDAVPSWANSANDEGAAAADTSVEGELYLPLRNASSAQRLAIAASTPGTRAYRHALSPRAWIAKYSPTAHAYDSVLSYLKSKGLTITGTPASRQYVVFRGTADQVGSVFSTDLHTYRYAHRKLVAPSVAPSLPRSVGSLVSGMTVDQARLLTKPDSVMQGQDLGTAPRTRSLAATPVVPTECSNYIGEHTATVPEAYGTTTVPTFNCGYTPAQMRSAYGLKTLNAAGLTGSGQTVANIAGYASPTIVDDVNTSSDSLGEPGLTSSTYRQIAPSRYYDEELCQYPSGWQGEQTLDVEAVHGIAPAAKILYVGGFNCGGGLDLAMSTILDNKLANIVSNSYGNVGEAVPADVIEGEQNLHIQAAGEGIGLYFSSGDNGDEVAALGHASPDFPASSPYVTSVGGTSLGIDKSGAIAFETGWGDTADKIVQDSSGNLVYSSPLPGSLFAGGAGGGTSAVNPEPAYQRGIVPDSLADGHRVSPDVAALADPYTGFLIGIRPIVDDSTGETGAYQNETYGGTSLASPLTAAQVALVQQLTHSTIGFANPTLYGLARVLPSTFRDVVPPTPPVAVAYTSKTSGNSYLMTFNTDTSLTTARGYDNVTGLGGISFNLLHQVALGRH
jgi:subtilase family serine protease